MYCLQELLYLNNVILRSVINILNGVEFSFNYSFLLAMKLFITDAFIYNALFNPANPTTPYAYSLKILVDSIFRSLNV